MNAPVTIKTPQSATNWGEVSRALFARAPDSNSFQRLRRRLAREVMQTLSAFAMHADASQRWLVGMSGGKDSHALLAILIDLKAQGRIEADLLACNLDQAQPGFPEHILPDYFTALGIPYRIDRRDTYSVVKEKTPKGSTYCTLCSRMRRGHLYRIAREENCSAVILGHHGDDALATFMMNMSFGGRLSAMAPKLCNDEGDCNVYRPLIRSRESDLARFATALDMPIIPCDLCGTQDGLQRQVMGRRLAEWEAAQPGTQANMLRALGNLRPGTLLDPEYSKA